MAPLDRYRRRVGIPTGGTDVSADSGAREIFGELEGFGAALSKRIGGMADRAARAEGERAGLAAGLDEEFRPTRNNTIRGEAYDAAGIRAALEREEAALGAQLDELALAHRADPEGLAKAIDALAGERISELDPDGSFPEIRVALTGGIARMKTSHVRQALRDAEAERRDRNLAALEQGTNDRTRRLYQYAYGNGLDEVADDVIDGEMGAIEANLQAAVDAGTISAQSAQKTIMNLKEDVTASRLKGVFDRLEDIGERQAMLEQLDREYGGSTGDAGTLGPVSFQNVRRHFEQGIKADLDAQQRIVNTLDKAWGDLENAAANGLPPTPDMVQKLRLQAEATGDPEALLRADQAEARMALAGDLQTRSPVEIEAGRRQLQEKAVSEGLTAGEREIFDVTGKVATAMDKGLRDAPYQWGLRAGVIKSDVAINWAGDAATVNSLKARFDAWEAMSAKYGDVPFFERAEMEALKHIAGQGGPQALAIAQAIVNALGQDAPVALEQISDAAPVLANMAGLANATGSVELAAETSQAQEMRRAPDYKPLRPKPEQATVAMGEWFGPAYMANAASANAVRGHALLLFEKRAHEAGMTDTDFDDNPEAKELWQAALDEAAGGRTVNGVKHGGVVSVNGSKVIAPPDMPAESVETRLRALSEADLQALPKTRSATGVAIRARDLQGAKLVSVGDGIYRVALGDPAGDDPEYVFGTNGDFWTLDIRRLRDIQGGRGMAGRSDRRRRMLAEDFGGVQ